MRLIDVDKIVFYTPRWSDGEGLFTKWLKETLKNAPTVDAVPVTRCKDCIHRDWDVIDVPYGLTKHIEWCSIRFNADGENIEVSPNDFCSKAESKVSSNFE